MPDLLIRGIIHTQDPSQPRAEAALAREGRFVRVGSRQHCEAEARGEVRLLEIGRGCAVPGLIDAHGHPRLHGQYLQQIRLQGARSEQECVERVVRYAAAVPKGGWLRGGGWDQNAWPARAFPGLEPLSAATPDHPVALERVDVHALWCNERALRVAGITAQTPEPPGGRIVRDASGKPTGVLVDTAMDLVRRAIPALTVAESKESILRSLRACAAAGLTCVHDAAASPEALEAYRELAKDDALPLRIYAMIDGQGEGLDDAMREWKTAPQIGLLAVRAVKLFADGALGSRGAALFDEYADDPGNAGLLLYDPRELEARIARIAAAGFQPCVHCIGDRACALVLQAFTHVPRDLRPRAEHLQVLRRRDLALLKRSSAVASMQPTHATSDGSWAEQRLGHGTERQRGAYAWKQALRAGAPLAFGSDFPVEEIDPRQGLRAAVTRRLPDGSVWMPEQRLTRAEALRAFTAGAAFAEFAEQRRGCIAEGFDADLTIFGGDVLKVRADDLPSVPIAATIVAGRIVHGGG